MTTIENRFWQFLLIIAGLLTAFVPVYVSYDLYGRGAISEKKIELSKLGSINPLKDLSGLDNKISLLIRARSESIDNIVIAKAWLRNTGRAPILSSDYFERISVNVKKPWKILAVGSADDLLRDVEFKWERVTDYCFEAVPALLNPGDRVSANIYLTNTENAKLTASEKTPQPEVEWRARIVNMKSFTYPPSPFERLGRRYWGINVNLMGWALPFTLGAALLFLAIYLRLLSRAHLLNEMRVFGILVVLGASFLSFAAAESMATYLFGNTQTDLFGVEHWMNAPWIMLHAILLIVLYGLVRRRTRVSATGSSDT